MQTNRAIRKGAAILLASAVLLASAACGFGNRRTTTDPQPKVVEKTGVITVVSSINQWGSLAAQIGGDDVRVTSVLASTGVDAHDFEPKTSDLRALGKAEIVVANGADYDSWATKSLSRNVTVVSAGQTVGATKGDDPHLWFSKDARSSMAQELTAAFSKARPAKKAAFKKRLKQWQQQEKALDETMRKFAEGHGKAAYAATESVAYYLMSDMGLKDVTPQGYLQAVMNGGEVAPGDLQEFQELLEGKKASMLVNNPQEASDATNMLTGTARKAEVPVVDVSEQMPKEYESLTDWISALVDGIATAVDPEFGCAMEDGDGSDGSESDADSDGDSKSDDAKDAGSGDASGSASDSKDAGDSAKSGKSRKCSGSGDTGASGNNEANTKSDGTTGDGKN